MIGINTMIASNGADQSSGIGFAIPINTAKAVLADLIRYGRVKRPSLGIVSYAIGPDLASQMGLAADSGVLIQRVLPGGAAERAGLRGGNEQAYVGNQPIMLGGDLIVAIDGQQVTDPEDISALMDKHQAGDTISVTDRARQEADDAEADSGRSEGHEYLVRRLKFVARNGIRRSRSFAPLTPFAWGPKRAPLRMTLVCRLPRSPPPGLGPGIA